MLDVILGGFGNFISDLAAFLANVFTFIKYLFVISAQVLPPIMMSLLAFGILCFFIGVVIRLL